MVCVQIVYFYQSRLESGSVYSGFRQQPFYSPALNPLTFCVKTTELEIKRRCSYYR